MATCGTKLSEELVAKMWQLFSEGSSVQAISRKLSVSRTTVHKYKLRLGWEKRRQSILDEANRKSDKKQISLLAENMKIVRFAKGRIIEKLREVALKDVTKTPIPDLDKIIRLEEFLQGRPDSRPQIDYSSYTEEQLTVEFESMIQELIKIPECREKLQKLLESPTE